jgi:hypothetical protein
MGDKGAKSNIGLDGVGGQAGVPKPGFGPLLGTGLGVLMIQLSYKESSHRNQVVHGPSDVTRIESSVDRVLGAKESLEDILEMKMSHTWTSLLSRL